MNINKPRVIKDFSKLDKEIQEQIKLAFPYGFADDLITFPNKDGNLVSALPFETEEKYYLVRMTVSQAIQIVEDDDDYDDEGELKTDAKEEYSDKYTDLNSISDDIGEDADFDDD